MQGAGAQLVTGALFTLALSALLTSITAAQAYPRLHVTALSQRADRAAVAPNDIFHVTIHVKIAQRRERLDELILGSFGNCEIISNETVRTAAADGTDFVERLTVQALTPGEATITPAYVDAFDPSIGKPMRFSSNPIRVRVTGGAPVDVGLRAFIETARRLLLAAAIAVGCVAAIFVLGVMFVRGRKRAPVAPTAVRPVPAPPAVAPDERLRRAADAYRTARSVASLDSLRGILFELAGVARGATLVDALRALGTRDEVLRAALLDAERAMFGPAGEREAAGNQMLTAIQAYGEPRAAKADAWIR